MRALTCAVVSLLCLPTLAVQPQLDNLTLQPGSQLAPGVRVGVIYSASDPVSGPAAAPLWGQTIEAGLDSYQLAVTWSQLEPTQDQIDLAPLQSLLDILTATRFTPYLVLQTLNTNLLDIPADLKDPNDPSRLRPGLTWDSPEMQARFGALLDRVAPALHDAGGFFLAVGNETDILLRRSASETQAFAGFVSAARDRVHALAPPGEPPLAVGANLTLEVLQAPAIAAAILSSSDWASFTIYPTENFAVLEPTVLGAELDALLALAGDKPVLLQEVGYPSGWRPVGNGVAPGDPGTGPNADTTPGPTNDSSEARQAEFFAGLAETVKARPQIRFVSVLHLADYSTTTLDFFQEVYGLDDPRFREFLGTLGVAWEDGTPKLAFPEVVRTIQALRRTRADLNGDGILDTGDITAFVMAYLAGEADANINNDSVLDLGDIAAFVQLFLGTN